MIRQCSCGKALPRFNKTGICQSCIRPSAPEKACKTCGAKLWSRNVTGYCLHHRSSTHMPSPEEFAKIAAGRTPSSVARELGIYASTVMSWAKRYDVPMISGNPGRQPTRKPHSIIRNPSALITAPIRREKEATLAAPPEPVRQWCAHCERNVRVAEAMACRSMFCKAKVAA